MGAAASANQAYGYDQALGLQEGFKDIKVVYVDRLRSKDDPEAAGDEELEPDREGHACGGHSARSAVDSVGPSAGASLSRRSAGSEGEDEGTMLERRARRPPPPSRVESWLTKWDSLDVDVEAYELEEGGGLAAIPAARLPTVELSPPPELEPAGGPRSGGGEAGRAPPCSPNGRTRQAIRAALSAAALLPEPLAAPRDPPYGAAATPPATGRLPPVAPRPSPRARSTSPVRVVAFRSGGEGPEGEEEPEETPLPAGRPAITRPLRRAGRGHLYRTDTPAPALFFSSPTRRESLAPPDEGPRPWTPPLRGAASPAGAGAPLSPPPSPASQWHPLAPFPTPAALQVSAPPPPAAAAGRRASAPTRFIDNWPWAPAQPHSQPQLRRISLPALEHRAQGEVSASAPYPSSPAASRGSLAPAPALAVAAARPGPGRH